MKLYADRPQGPNAITAYSAASFTINGQTYFTSLIVGHDRLLPDWPVAKLEDLLSEHLTGLDQGCELVLLGTGARQRFPHPSVLRFLFEKRIGVEVMDTAAACRTYNVLLSEGRAVVAALIIE